MSNIYRYIYLFCFPVKKKKKKKVISNVENRIKKILHFTDY